MVRSINLGNTRSQYSLGDRLARDVLGRQGSWLAEASRQALEGILAIEELGLELLWWV